MSDFDKWFNTTLISRHLTDVSKIAFNAGKEAGIREGMDRAAVLVEQANHGAGNVFEHLSKLIRTWREIKQIETNFGKPAEQEEK